MSKLCRGVIPRSDSGWQKARLELVGGQGRQATVEFGGGQLAEGQFALTGGILEHPSRLPRDPESGEDRPVSVADVGERQSMVVDEVVDFGLRAVPADSDDGDFSGPLLADRLDRGGCTITCDSIRCPEPEGHGCANVTRAEITCGCGRLIAARSRCDFGRRKSGR